MNQRILGVLLYTVEIFASEITEKKKYAKNKRSKE